MSKRKKNRPQSNGKAEHREPSWADPTNQRVAKEPEGFEVTDYVGGQRSYLAKTVLDSVKEHMNEAEWTAVAQFKDLAEKALVGNDVICKRAYTGMPYSNNASNEDGAALRAEAYAKFEGIVRELVDEFFVTTAFALVLGVRKEATGQAVSLEEFGAKLMRWTDKPTRKGGALVAIRATARVIMRAQKRWEVNLRERRRERVTAQEAFEHGRKVERYESRALALKKLGMREQVESHFASRGTG